MPDEDPCSLGTGVLEFQGTSESPRGVMILTQILGPCLHYFLILD